MVFSRSGAMLFFTSCFQLNLIEYKVDSKSRKRNGAGGVGGEKRLGYQEEDKGSKRRRRIGVRGGPVEGSGRNGGRQHSHSMNLSCKKSIARISKIPLFS